VALTEARKPVTQFETALGEREVIIGQPRALLAEHGDRIRVLKADPVRGVLSRACRRGAPVLLASLLVLGGRALAGPRGLATGPAEEAPSRLYLPLVAGGHELSLRVISQFGGLSSAVALVGPYVYLGRGDSVVVLDASDPASLREVATLRTDGFVNRITVQGNLAFVAANGVRVLDVSRPAAPRQIGATSWSGTAVSGNAAAMFLATDASILAVDMGNPASPRYAGNWHMPVRSGRKSVIVGAAALGTALYVSTSLGLFVLDATLPNRLTIVAERDLPPGQIAISGSTAVLLAGSDLIALDLTQPLAPSRVGQVTVCPAGNAADEALVARKGWAALLCAEDEQGARTVHWVDLRNPAAPREVGSAQTIPSTSAGIDNADLALSEHRVYVSGGDANLSIFEAEQPTGLRAVGVLRSALNVTDAAVSDDMVVVLERTAAPGRDPQNPSRLVVADFADRARPKGRGRVDLEGGAYLVRVAGRTAVVAGFTDNGQLPTGPGFLQTVSLADPDRPVAVGRLALDSRAVGLVLRGGFAFLVDQTPALRVVDASDPSLPRLVGELPLSGTVLPYRLDVSQDGDMLYVATSQSAGLTTVWVVDTSSPTRPQVVGQWDGADVIETLAASPGRLYVGETVDNAQGRLTTLDVTNPTRPRAISRRSLPYRILSLTAHARGRLTLAGGFGDSLSLLDAPNGSWLQPLGSLSEVKSSQVHTSDLGGNGLVMPRGSYGLALVGWDP
jgi:hypothetical protein